MKKIHKLLAVLGVAAAALTGCASAPKPIMSLDEQSKGGFLMAGLNQCTANGMMDAYIASRGRGFLESRLNKFAYDPANVQAGFDKAMRSGKEPSRADCASMAITVHTWIGEVNAVNEREARDRQIMQDAVNNRPRNTYCNRVGTQTLCSTY
jgi:hypothetical protein